MYFSRKVTYSYHNIKNDGNKIKFCTRGLQNVTKTTLSTKFNKVDNLSRYYIFFWDYLMYHISTRVV